MLLTAVLVALIPTVPALLAFWQAVRTKNKAAIIQDGVEVVHDLVNSNHKVQVDRITQLTAALTASGTSVPPAPPMPVTAPKILVTDYKPGETNA
jgi:hypothetical protein